MPFPPKRFQVWKQYQMWEGMDMDTLELLLHPVRLRVVHAMSGGRICATAELCARLPDIPKTTLYRHIGLLVAGGVLEIADERRVRGAVERYYRLHPARGTIDARAGAAMSLDDHRHAFAGAMAVLLAEFNAYLNSPGAAPFADSVGYRQGILWLNPEELTDMLGELLTVVATRSGNGPAPGRRPHLTSMIMFPTEETGHDDNVTEG
ncbi:helix-turn-helix domain-containing protein [Nocardia sp. NPDC051570]|uniref:helix-turn-helix domain-containing protein n=1 Tax=Nocardia sp. NPDC051570 TaxID=3364324 RepID=UPI00378AD7FA